MSDVIIGVMSGSSLDGIDLAACSISENNGLLEWKLLDQTTVPLDDAWKKKLADAPALSGYELMKLDAAFGELIGTMVRAWLQDKEMQKPVIASHGHTVFHDPTQGFTTQIGSGAHIAAITGLKTITQFRNLDVAHGGQGAPFAPVADRALFPGHEGYLNLGGIVNVHLVNADGRWLAWDIGPCNQALNYLAAKAGHPYDEDGMLALKGATLDAIRHDLIAMYPFHGGHPLSLSNQQVKATWIDYLEGRTEAAEDLLSTTTRAIVDMIMLHISPVITRPAKIMVTGGGAHNRHLMELLQKAGMDYGLTFDIPEARIIDHKESVMMALLGWMRLHQRPSGIYALTGARVDSIGGAIFEAYP